ncbi:MAG: hotdog fold thioesterase [Actinocatenispora sp.]
MTEPVEGTTAAEAPPELLSFVGTLAERMGIELVSATPQRVEATMPVEGNTQPYGLLHGGASCVLAETVGSIGAVLHAGPGGRAVGVDINATHHLAARSGTVTGVATALRLGRSVATYEIEISDDSGRRVCTARLTCVVQRAAPAADAG